MTTPTQHTLRRLAGVVAAVALSSCALAAVVLLLPAGQARPALAQGIMAGAITQTTVSDFNVCTVLTGTANRILTGTIVANTSGGEIRIASFLEDYFDGASVDASKWLTSGLSGAPPPVIGGGFITVDNSQARSVVTVPVPGRYIEMRARFAPLVGNGDIGFGRTNQPGAPQVTCPGNIDCDGSNRLFISLDPTAIFANARDGMNPANNTQILGLDHTQFHLYRIEWNSNQTYYTIDGAFLPTATVTTTFPSTYTPYVWLYTTYFAPPRPLVVDWVRVNYYPTTTGQYQSCAVASPLTDTNWTNINWTAGLPGGTSAQFETRSSANGTTWSGWTPITGSGGAIPSPNGNYLQYRVTLSTTNVNASPEIGSVSLGYELNEAPIANANGPYTVSEGVPLVLSGALSTDPNGDAITYAWDLNNDGVFTDAAGVTATVTFPNGPSTPIVGLRVTDESGVTGTQTTTVTVNNVAPAASTTGPYTGNEGSAIAFTGVFTDPGSPGETYSFLWSFGDGVTSTLQSPGHTYADNGVFTVVFTTTDSDGGIGVASTTATIANVAPAVMTTGPYAGNEGSAIAFTGVFTDPGSADTHTFLWSFGDGVTSTLLTPSHTYVDNGAYTAVFTTTDDDGGIGVASTSAAIANVAPTATFSATGPINEGGVSTLSLTSPADPSSADTAAGFRYSFACPGQSLATSYATAITGTTANCTLFTSGVVTVTSRIFDKDNGFTTYTRTVTVNNVAPTASTTGPYAGNEGSVIAFTGVFTDPGSPAETYSFRWSFGDGVTSTLQSPSRAYADNGSFTVVFTTTDSDGGIGVASTTATIANVAPTATFSATSPIDEGSASTLSLTSPADPSTADTAAGFRYSFACPGESLAGTYGAAGTSTSRNCSLADNGAFTVTSRIFDKDNGFTTYTRTVTVNNVAPSLSITTTGSVLEGSPATVVATVFDPGSLDTFTYWYDCRNDGVYENGPTSSNTALCLYLDDTGGPFTVRVRVRDNDGGETTATGNVNVINVAPIAGAINNGPVGEGSPVTITADQTDPGTLDTFQYRFDCNNDWFFEINWQDGATAQCTFSDNGSYPVHVVVRDDDLGQSSPVTTTVTVNNVAPTATFNAASPIVEGSSSALSLTGPSDPSSVDTAAGLRFSFACPGQSLATSYATASPTSSAGCAFDDNGVYTVTSRIFDKDDGFTTYTRTVTVNNAAPVVSTTGPYSGDEGIAIAFTGVYTDPGPLDTHTFLWSFGDGATSTSRTPLHTYADNGVYTAVFTATDDDGGVGAISTTVTVANVAPTANAGSDRTVNEGQTFSLSGSGVDVPADPLTFEWDFNYDGVTFTVDATGANVSTSYPDGPAVFTVALRVSDDDGGSAIDTLVVTVENVPPTASASNDGPVDEGDAATITIARSDPSPLDTFQYRFDCEADGVFETGWQSSLQRLCPFADNGLFEVRAQVRDDDGGMSSIVSTFVLVNNVAPAVSTTGPYISQVGQPISLTGIFTDPGALDTHTFLWDFGDGVTSTLQSPAHTYTTRGVFTATFTVTDDDGGSGTVETTATINEYVVFLPTVMRNASESAPASSASRVRLSRDQLPITSYRQTRPAHR